VGGKLFHLCINAGLLRPAVPIVPFEIEACFKPRYKFVLCITVRLDYSPYFVSHFICIYHAIYQFHANCYRFQVALIKLQNFMSKKEHFTEEYSEYLSKMEL
jgi:hypothetical protein